MQYVINFHSIKYNTVATRKFDFYGIDYKLQILKHSSMKPLKRQYFSYFEEHSSIQVIYR